MDSQLSGLILIDESEIQIKKRLGSGQFGEVFHGYFHLADIAFKVNTIFLQSNIFIGYFFDYFFEKKLNQKEIKKQFP